MINIGIIGCGHWGPNHIRNFSNLDGVIVSSCADQDDKRLAFVKKHYPSIKLTNDYRDILKDETINTVVVATPASSHYCIVKESLEYGKDVLCEKPLTQKVAEAEELVELANRTGNILMVGHTFLFNVGIRKLKEYIDGKLLGQTHYINSIRTNLGPIRRDVNVVWDLAAHDVSIVSYLIGSQPITVTARGEAYLREKIEDVAFISLTYPPNILTNVHISWIHPQKTRIITIVGSKKMVTWDDLNNIEPIKIYDKGVVMQEPYYESYGEFKQILLRDGDIVSPKVDLVEPLKVQSEHFIDCIRQRKKSICDGVFGLNVVRVLEAIQTSMVKGAGAGEISI